MEKRQRIQSNDDAYNCDSLHRISEFEIEGNRFKFNKVLTAAIFHFMRSRLNLIESKSDTVSLTNISAETFRHFLDTNIYNYGNGLWGYEHLSEIWETAHVLKIPSLIENCETQVGKMISLETFDKIYAKANAYQSNRILCKARNFLLHMFRLVQKIGLMRILTFEDLIYAVASEELRIKNEDIVLRSMFEWAEYNQMQLQENLVEVSQKKTKLDNSVPCKEDVEGDPSSKFSKLLRASRYGLASVECLVELSKHHLCEQDKEAKLVITEAISYKLERHIHGYWPHYALHRSCHVRHVGVSASKDQVSALVLEMDDWKDLPKCSLHAKITNLSIFDDELYVISSLEFQSLLFVFTNKEWKFVSEISGSDFIVLSKGRCIYIIDGKNCRIKCVMPKTTPVLHSEIKFPDMMRNPESALDYDKSILIFCSTDSDEKLAVISLDVPEHKWTDCGHLEGSAKNLVGFRNETKYFILQRDGAISQVLRNQDDSIGFILIKRLWSIQNSLRGAFIYNDVLYIYGDTPIEPSCFRAVSGLFWKIDYWFADQETSNFVHWFVPSVDLWGDGALERSESYYDFYFLPNPNNDQRAISGP
ncbi:uncharacterized protein LOC106068331 isoform X1 [Biomphalaria glabrata]|uniref:Uncharacterized protein LOC106068331 isoform X1 n=2 Tax=Biomphalaria glabrata TaxID=6526 RepID=A0A9U8EDY9_BIOGL|nr:uncharacterized protein LOC106068331 isoform X1 [Biomphalaria glabrata]